jgi:peptide deformylase
MTKATKDNIITLPNKHLREASKKVGVITEDTTQLVQKMVEATLDWEDSREHEIGVALAAVQIDTLLRVVIIRNDFNDKADRTFNVFINPEITKLEGELLEDHEGCLSITDVYGLVPRHSKIRVKALNEEGREVRVKAEGFLARVFQHEIDHTNGIVFIDHIEDKEDNFFKLDNSGSLQSLNYNRDITKNPILWT